MPYDMGDEALDQAIVDLVASASDNGNQELIREIVTTALKLHRDAPERGDLKLINTALKEMRYSMLVFARYRDEPKVTIYGSARTKPGEPNYELTKEFARIMAEERNWGVVTGAGPGIMRAGNEGAGLSHSYGVNIRLPFEANANEFIDPNKLINFKYFFTRKLGFVKESHAFVLCPGGFGTMDETFELLTLVQTGKSDIHPIVLLEAEGTGYWDGFKDFVDEQLLQGGMISEADKNLYLHTSDPQAAADEIVRFYANYQSQRFVDGTLILRLNKAPDAALLAELNSEFADILPGGPMEVIEATDAETRDADNLHLERLRVPFDRRQFGRLRLLINRLNQDVASEPVVHPPAAFTEEQQERPW